MAIDAKVDFMNQLEAKLADVITASEIAELEVDECTE